MKLFKDWIEENGTCWACGSDYALNSAAMKWAEECYDVGQKEEIERLRAEMSRQMGENADMKRRLAGSLECVRKARRLMDLVRER